MLYENFPFTSEGRYRHLFINLFIIYNDPYIFKMTHWFLQEGAIWPMRFWWRINLVPDQFSSIQFLKILVLYFCDILVLVEFLQFMTVFPPVVGFSRFAYQCLEYYKFREPVVIKSKITIYTRSVVTEPVLLNL